MSPISPLLLKELLEQATYFAQCGARVLQHYWEQSIVIEEKGGFSNLVTQVDKEAEETILGALKQRYPTHQLLAEESGSYGDRQSPYTWVIDPLDGTTNYAHKYPMVAVSIGLLFNQEPIVGVVLNPILQETFQAAKGLGTFLNGCRLQVSSIKQLSQSLLASGFAYDRRQMVDTNYPEFSAFTHVSQGVRRGGSAALDLAYVAAGRLDGYWERGLQPWDMAAGILLVQEANGYVTGYDQLPYQLERGEILATNGHIHAEMSQKLLELRHKRATLPTNELTFASILN